MMKREAPLAESDCREGLVHNMMTAIRKTISPARNDTAAGPGGTPRSVALNPRAGLVALALFAAMAVGMLYLLPGSPLHAQDAGPIEYAENGTDPVATFTATDPEGETITWSLATGDRRSDDFMIENGVLAVRQFSRLRGSDGR